MSTESLQALIDQVDAELADSRFLRRTHFHRKTYDAGCRGPLCSQAVSEYQSRIRLQQHPGTPTPNKRGRERARLAPLLAALAQERGLPARQS